MSLSTLPRTATMSATLPASSVPTSFSTPSSLAASRVPASSAAAGTHAEVRHQPELHAIHAVRIDAGVGAEARSARRCEAPP